ARTVNGDGLYIRWQYVYGDSNPAQSKNSLIHYEMKIFVLLKPLICAIKESNFLFLLYTFFYLFALCFSGKWKFGS
ncbi:Replicase polyprotein 1a, partial [Bienertia sinuspersici]